MEPTGPRTWSPRIIAGDGTAGGVGAAEGTTGDGDQAQHAGTERAAAHDHHGRTTTTRLLLDVVDLGPGVDGVERAEQLLRRIGPLAASDREPSWRLTQPSRSTSRRQPGQVRTCDQARSSSLGESWPSTSADAFVPM